MWGSGIRILDAKRPPQDSNERAKHQSTAAFSDNGKFSNAYSGFSQFDDKPITALRQEDISMLSHENANLRDMTRRLMDDQAKSTAALETKLVLVTQQNQQLKELLEAKSRELTSQAQTASQFEAELREFEQNRVTPYKLKINDYERKLYICTTEIDRLNRVMVEKSAEWKQSIDRLRVLEKEKAGMTSTLQDQLDLKVRLAEYENRIAVLLQEIERLNMKCRSQQEHAELAQKNSRVSENKMLQTLTDVNEMKHRINELTIINQGFKRREREFEEGIRSTIQKQNRIAGLCQQVERLTAQNKMLMTKQRDYQGVIAKLSRQAQQADRSLAELSQARRKIGQSEHRIGILSHEIERLNILVQSKTVEMNTANRRLLTFEKVEMSMRNLQTENSQLREKNIQLAERTRNSQQQCGTLRMRTEKSAQQIEQLCLRVVQLEKEIQTSQQREEALASFSVAKSQYQEKVSIFSHEIERLNVLIENKAALICSLEAELQQGRTAYLRLESQLSEVATRLEEARQSNRKIEHYQNRVSLLLQEIDRLNRKQSQLNRLDLSRAEAESRAGMLSREVESGKQQVHNYQQQQTTEQFSIEKLTREFDKANQQVTELAKENMRLQSLSQGNADQRSQTPLKGSQTDRLLAILDAWHQEVRTWRSFSRGDPVSDSKLLEIQHLVEALEIEVGSLKKRMDNTNNEMKLLRQASGSQRSLFH